MNTANIATLTLITSAFITSSVMAADAIQTTNAQTINITEQNFTHAETARNYRNWASKGATHEFVKMQGLPPRGQAAPTVQMNDDTLYGVAIVKAIDGFVTFSIPKTNNYMAVQIVTERGHGQHYIVEDGHYTVSVESEYAFVLYRSGTENGIAEAKAELDKVDTSDFNFATDYQVQPYNYDDVEVWVKKYTQEVNNMQNFTYTFPRTSDKVTDLHQWNLENAAGWGGASPEAFVGNKYSNSPKMQANVCYTATFSDPKNQFFTSITAYDADKYLIEGVSHVSSNTWQKNTDDSVTVSFNCGDSAKNNIDTKGKDFTFTSRHYGVNPTVMAAKQDPIISALEASAVVAQ
ncbi:DUF1214 domain-containing protein [Vibrio methylphosphonaticus]|uniref:DUF1214 domain-containing protein n=1 Tax=Vibrio methylphosphonaticus TaxID=2946866 RepID=UPI00202A1CE7|nr:DUF1214 domain-containing protein [Vibrio methylphosphonaticus]MCL9775644.1 DUF1214 domain-containing protein [Vibrio methylphosphonaticus]